MFLYAVPPVFSVTLVPLLRDGREIYLLPLSALNYTSLVTYYL